MVRMVANESFNYGIPHRLLGVGEEFDALSESDANVLRAAGKAKDAPVAKSLTTETRAMTSREGEADLLDQPTQSGKRYNRRDMRAKE